jgi:signal transduction histidine kinase
VTRWTAIALALVIAALTAVVAWVIRTVERDRAALVQRFSEENLARLENGAQEIEADLDDITDDLRFAGQLVHAADSPADRERELRALLAVVNQYRLVTVYDEAGRRVLTVADPISPDYSPDAFLEASARLAADALRRPAGEIVTSPQLGGDPGGWFRAFATRLPGPGGAIVIVVETASFFRKLDLVADGVGERILLLGAHGAPLPVTDPAVAAAMGRPDLETHSPTLAGLRARMWAAETGALVIPAGESTRLGLGSAAVVAVHVPIRLRGGRHWSAAILSSTSALERRERSMMIRIGVTSGAIALCLIVFGAYAVLASRRAIAIRERLKNAEHLAHLMEKTEKILDNVPAAVLVLAEDGNVTAVNRVLRDTVPASAIGGDLARVLPQAPAAVTARLRQLVEAARASGRVRTLYGEQMALFGHEGQYSLHAVPLEQRFPDARTLLVIEDVSEVHSLASQLVRAEKLSTVGVLAAGIAHEIGTPLGVVRARAELLLGRLPPEQAAGAKIIVEQIDRITRTLRQLLDFSRVKPADASAVSVSSIARAVVELLRYEAERRRVTLETDVPDDLPAVAADPDELQQVLVNLVLNACDAYDASGPDAHEARVTIRARADETADPPGRLVRIEIIDAGSGIPDELRHQIFDPFFTTKKRGKGTGLGLSIAAQIVRNHGGRIDLESEPQRGTRVTLLWPTAGARARRETHVAAS